MIAPPGEPGAPPGAAPERTRLAWQRTLLATGVSALLAISLVAHRHATGAVVALLLAALLTVVAAVAVVGGGRVAAIRAGTTAASPGRPMVVTALVVALAGLALALVLTVG